MNLYDKYHSNRKLEKRVISQNDFTHKPLLNILKGRLYRYKKILDIGCGTGTVCFYFAKNGIYSVGIDISKKAIALAKINAKYLFLTKQTKFYYSDFPGHKESGKFDLIICTEVLEHLHDDNRAMSEIYSLLNPGGELIVSVPLKSSFLYRHRFLEKFDNEVGHLRRYSESELKELIQNEKFRIIKIDKNQGFFREYLFTSTTRSFLVKLANRFEILSKLLTYIDEKLYFMGVSNIIILAKK